MSDLDLNAISHITALHQGWGETARLRILDAYRTFLAAAAHRSGGEPMVPTREVDALWHAHMLHSETYWRDCRRWFGAYVHHRPRLKKAEAELLAALGLIPNALATRKDGADCFDQTPNDHDSAEPTDVHLRDCSSAERPPRPSPPPLPQPLPRPRPRLADCSDGDTPPECTAAYRAGDADCASRKQPPAPPPPPPGIAGGGAV